MQCIPPCPFLHACTCTEQKRRIPYPHLPTDDRACRAAGMGGALEGVTSPERSVHKRHACLSLFCRPLLPSGDPQRSRSFNAGNRNPTSKIAAPRVFASTRAYGYATAQASRSMCGIRQGRLYQSAHENGRADRTIGDEWGFSGIIGNVLKRELIRKRDRIIYNWAKIDSFSGELSVFFAVGPRVAVIPLEPLEKTPFSFFQLNAEKRHGNCHMNDFSIIIWFL